MVSVAKCPLCNNNILKKDVRFRLESLRLMRPPKVLEYIDSILDKFSKHWDVDDIVKTGFLADIEKVEDEIVMESIRKFDSKGGIQKGFGVKYLAGMIKNESKRILLRREYERKKLDRIPPKLKDINEEY